MNNPWKEIELSDYESHMKLDSVRQLQTLNQLMKKQLDDYDVHTVMILGIAGGNGLEHVDRSKYKRVYGVDINESYLKAVTERFEGLSDTLKCLKIDIIDEVEALPKAELLIANLLIEYVGYEAFTRAVQKVKPKYVSCVIQINETTNQISDEMSQNDDTGKQWVSASPYIHAFDGLDVIHHQMEANALTEAMEKIGYV